MAEIGATPQTELKSIIEAVLLAAGEPVNLPQLLALFEPGEEPDAGAIQRALEELEGDLEPRGIELVETASGYRLQTRRELQPWISRLWAERPQRYSRALLETMALIAYRQPITRGEIEEVRGVSVSSGIIRALQEREWIRVVGHRDVPGKPALFGTTRAFLDYFNLKNLDDLPTLAEIRDMENLEPEFAFDMPVMDAAQDPGEARQAGAPSNTEADAGREPDHGRHMTGGTETENDEDMANEPLHDELADDPDQHQQADDRRDRSTDCP